MNGALNCGYFADFTGRDLVMKYVLPHMQGQGLNKYLTANGHVSTMKGMTFFTKFQVLNQEFEF